jgi:hypothetical protein
VPQNLLLKDGQLYKHWRTYPFLRILTATGKDEFFFRYEYVRVHFERDAKGNLVKSVWQWPQRRPHNIFISERRHADAEIARASSSNIGVARPPVLGQVHES